MAGPPNAAGEVYSAFGQLLLTCSRLAVVIMSSQEPFKIKHSTNATPSQALTVLRVDALNFQAMTNSKFHFKQKTNCREPGVFHRFLSGAGHLRVLAVLAVLACPQLNSRQLDSSRREVFAEENEANLSSLARCLLNCKHMLLPGAAKGAGRKDNGQS